MNDEIRDLRQKVTSLSDEELVEMVTVASGDYREDALNIARMELRSRGVDFSNPVQKEEEKDSSTLDPLRPTSPGVGDGATCVCGGKLRAGVLVGEREITMVFNDSREERFVKVLACRECGQISLIADLDTNVES